MDINGLKPGTRVRIAQTMHYRDRAWSTEVEGVVRAVRSEPTGSWHAHGKDGKLWLYRLELQKDDGELTKLVIDQDSRITVLSPASA